MTIVISSIFLWQFKISIWKNPIKITQLVTCMSICLWSLRLLHKLITQTSNKVFLLFIPVIIFFSYMIFIIFNGLNFDYLSTFTNKGKIKYLIQFKYNVKWFVIIWYISIFFKGVNVYLERKINPIWVKFQLFSILSCAFLSLALGCTYFLVNKYLILKDTFHYYETIFVVNILLITFATIGYAYTKLILFLMFWKVGRHTWLKNFKVTNIIISLFVSVVIWYLGNFFIYEQSWNNFLYILFTLTICLTAVSFLIYSTFKPVSSNMVLISNALSVFLIWCIWFIYTRKHVLHTNTLSLIGVSALFTCVIEIVTYISNPQYKKYQYRSKCITMFVMIFILISYAFLSNIGFSKLTKLFDIEEIIAIFIPLISIIFLSTTLMPWIISQWFMSFYVRSDKKKKGIK